MDSMNKQYKNLLKTPLENFVCFELIAKEFLQNH
jgi:hypothetical protein